MTARRVATFLAAIGALVMSSGVALMVTAGPSNAAEGADCVPAAAYTETVNHPAVTHVVHHDAVAAVESQWWNFAPNHTDGPFVGTPSFPTDEGGTWEGPHTEGGPSGTGTFQAGDGHGSWFHRSPAVEGQAAYDETVTDTPASTETINHAAVTCGAVESEVVVSPPKAHTPKAKAPAKAHTTTKAPATVTPTVVHAGLVGTSAQDLRGEQGLALIFAGMVMLMAAGGLGLRLRGAVARI